VTSNERGTTRRRALAVGAGAAVGSVALPASWFHSDPLDGTTVKPGTWPAWRRDPARTGHDPDGSAPTREPDVAWRTTLPDDNSARTRLAASRGALYVATDRRLRAVDAATGETRWERTRLGTLAWDREPLWVEGGPALHDGQVLLGASVSAYGLDRDDGRAEWQYRTNSSLDATLRAGNTVYVASSVGDGDRLVAIDAASGLERWKTPADRGVVPTASAGGYVVGPPIGPDGSIAAVDAGSGGVEWTRDLPGEVSRFGDPCIADGTVYVGGETLSALSLTGGSTRWSRSLGVADADAVRPPVSDGGTAYLVAGEPARALAVGAERGDIQWEVDLPPVPPGGAPALVDGTLYVGLESGVLALDAVTGEELFRVTTSGGANLANSPIVAGGRLFVALGRRLYAMEEP